jgi:DNA invertase Pin-like site-specific DNA recombinase
MPLIGYARVSTAKQSLALQRDALKAAGCEMLFEDQASGTETERPGLADALAYLRRGDTLIVWKLDRLGRSLAHLIKPFRTCKRAVSVFAPSITEGIDTTTPAARSCFTSSGRSPSSSATWSASEPERPSGRCRTRHRGVPVDAPDERKSCCG